MGKSPAACFNIIACGRESVDHQDLPATNDSKTSSDRRGWSFRKRSARHRILSNSVISEPASSVKKEAPVSSDVNFQVPSDLVVPEKNPVIQNKEEKIELSAQQSSKLPDGTADKEDDFRDDAVLDESGIIVIQAAVRGFLVRRGLLKEKKVIKLQAVVRGYLVRRRAVGTLRCVQAIIKMQALVRARRARQLVLGDSEKESQGNEKDSSVPAISRRKKEAKSDGLNSYTSIEKLLRNGLARQLLESTHKSKSINIKCDLSKSDSSWKWLERWMSASSIASRNTQALESGSGTEKNEKGNIGISDDKSFISVPSDCFHVPSNSEPVLELLEQRKPLHSESGGSIFVPSSCSDPINDKSCVGVSDKDSTNSDNITCFGRDNLDLQASRSLSPSSSHPELQVLVESDVTCDVSEFTSREMKETNSDPVEAKSPTDEKEIVNKREITGVKSGFSELPETEGKRFSRKASNPAFIAAQSKFEELSSAPKGAKLDTPPSQEAEVEFSLDKVSVVTDRPISSQNVVTMENSSSNDPTVHIGGSECGTELSVSSTLDSPDRSDQIEREPKNSISMIDSSSREKTTPEHNGPLKITSGPELVYDNTSQLESFASMDSFTGDLSHANAGQLGKDASIDSVKGDLSHTNSGQVERGVGIDSLTDDLSPNNAVQAEKDVSINPAPGDQLHTDAGQGGKDESINSATGDLLPTKAVQGAKDESIDSGTEDLLHTNAGQGGKDGSSNSADDDLLYTNASQREKDGSIDLDSGNCDSSVFDGDSQQLDKIGEDPDILSSDQVSEVSNLVHKPSPDASPRSQLTITESQTTPSGQVSSKPKKNRGEKSETNIKNRSLSSGKNSPANLSEDPSPRTSLERLPKEHKSGKRRNFLSTTKSDHVDQETKDSNSSHSRPSYMQATESARAKAISSISPRSSPDAHEKDVYMKKRFSLPNSNGRQESPRIQRSLSQAQPNAKGNGTNSPQDRKWRR